MSMIVLIEDNEQNARLAAKLITLAGHDVLQAGDGEEGMALVEDVVPDLILVDLGLPDMDGQTVVALLRQQPALEQVPIIAFTAWPQDTAYDMALAYGCDGVIIKPINTRTFADEIDSYLEKTGAV